MEKIILEVTGMSCKHCAAKVENKLNEVEGVQKAQVNLKKSIAKVKASEVESATLITAVEELGYTAKILDK